MAKKSMTLEEKLEEAIVKEAPYEVPGNWVWTYMGNVGEYINGKAFKPTEWDTVGLPIIRIQNLTGTNEKYNYFNRDLDSKYKIKDGDLLMAWSATLDAFLWNGGNAVLNQHIFKVESRIDRRYHYYLLKNTIQEMYAKTHGTGMVHITKGKFEKLEIPIPPLKEQQRIVDRIESLFEKLDKAKELIEEVREGFEKRKSGIFKNAFSGGLTIEWRKENIILENNILNEIREYYSDKLNKKDIKILSDFQNRATEYEMIENSKWVKCNIGSVAKVSNGSTPSRKKKEFWNGTIPWVSSGEVRNNRITFTKEYITEQGFSNSSVKLLSKGSVLMAMIGEGKTRGQSSILDIEATTNQNIAAIEISHGHVISEFLWYWLQYNYKKNRDSGKGTGPKALNCQKVRELDFILPPLKEQKEIVRILDKLLGEESKIEELTQLEEQIELIKKSILAKAFRGKLGTNCEDDESALELLKEILRKE